MNAECFLDTNIQVYAATRDSSKKYKRKKAIGLIAQEDFGLSAQVLQEFHVVVTRKLKVTLQRRSHWNGSNSFLNFHALTLIRI